MLFWIVLQHYGRKTTRLHITDDPDRWRKRGGVACIGGFKNKRAANIIFKQWHKTRGLEKRLVAGQQICVDLSVYFYVDKAIPHALVPPASLSQH